jgi:hypothetical protein
VLADSSRAIFYLAECLPIFHELHLPSYEEQALRALDACRATSA